MHCVCVVNRYVLRESIGEDVDYFEGLGALELWWVASANLGCLLRQSTPACSLLRRAFASRNMLGSETSSTFLEYMAE